MTNETQNGVVPYQAPAALAGTPIYADLLIEVGKRVAQSGFFKDAKDANQAYVKMLYGAELGIPPISSMMGVHIIEGKPSYSANIMATAIKKSGVHDYRVRTLDNQSCDIEYFDRTAGGWESVGHATFTMADAKAAGLENKDVWRRYPRNMLFSRAMSNGFRWYCPDLTGGAPAYTPEELGVDVDPESGAPLARPEPQQPRIEQAASQAPRAPARQSGTQSGNFGSTEFWQETREAHLTRAQVARYLDCAETAIAATVADGFTGDWEAAWGAVRAAFAGEMADAAPRPEPNALPFDEDGGSPFPGMEAPHGDPVDSSHRGRR